MITSDRVLVRILSVGETTIQVIVPRWRSEIITIPQSLLAYPDDLLDSLATGGYLTAKVNLDAKMAGELFFNELEKAPCGSHLLDS